MSTSNANRTAGPVRLPARWLAPFCLACLLAACGAPTGPGPAPVREPGTLRLEVTPAGARVFIHDEEKGQTPLTLQLPAGSYALRVQMDGYASLQRTAEVLPGQQTVISDALRDVAIPVITWSELPASIQAGQTITITAKATDNQAVAQMRLWIDRQLVAESAGATLEHAWNTQGQAPGPHALVVQAEDDGGNTGQESRSVNLTAAAATRTATTSPAPVKAAGVSTREIQMTLSVYPFQAYLNERRDQRYNFSVLWLDRQAYQAANPRPEPRSFKAVVLENQYLILTFLPELGGRLLQCTFKPTGQDLFYHNTVLKPSYWGPLNREENWWLAAGGMEWALPVNEHGYESGTPWDYHVEQAAHEVSMVLRDSSAEDRLRAQVRVTLPEDRACFIVAPRLQNPTSQTVSCQFWINAALTLGSASASPGTEFVIPTQSMIVHSTGDPTLPGEHQSMSWPLYNGRDLSRYGNWQNWLGVFVPEIQQGYAGAYNHDTGLGIVRVFPHEVARGLKLFAFGANFPARSEYTDDGSEYLELWGGPCRTFWPEDDVSIAAGQAVEWSEVWLPFAGIGGLDSANADAAAHVAVQSGQVDVGIAVSSAQQGQVRLLWDGQTLYEQPATLGPTVPLIVRTPLPDGATLPGELGVEVRDQGGKVLLKYTKMIQNPSP